MSSSDNSSSGGDPGSQHDAEHAAPAAAQKQTRGAPASGARALQTGAKLLLDGVLDVVGTVLTSCLNPEQVEKAIEKARKTAAYKGLQANIASGAINLGSGGGGKGKKGKGGGAPAGPKAIRHTYQAFTTCAMAALKAAERADLASMTTVGNTWKRLPAAIRRDVEARMGLLRDKYNETLAAGGEVGSLVEMLKTLEAQNKLKPLDWVTFIEEYHNAPLPDEAAPTPAPAATPAKRPVEGGEGGSHHKEHKKSKEDKEGKKHKKHKKDKKEKKRHASDSE